MNYEINYVGNSIIISDENRIWTANIYIEGLTYEKVRENREAFPKIFDELYKSYDLKMSTPVVEVFDGIEYLIIEGNVADTNMIIGMSGLDSDYSICFEIFTQNNDYNRDFLKDISFIMSNAVYTGDSKKLNYNTPINMKDTMEILKKSIEQ